MTVQVVPTRSQAHFRQTTTLDGTPYVLAFDWHQRWGRWTIGIYDQNDNAIATGLTLLPGLDLIEHLTTPPGSLILADQSGDARAPTFDSLGDSLFALLYVEAG